MRPRGLCPRGCMRLVPGVLVSPACLSPTPTPLRGEPGENTRGAKAAGGIARTGVADARVVDLDAHLVRLGRRHLDVLDGELLARLPRHGRLAGDGLFRPASAVAFFRLGLLRGPARSYAGERGGTRSAHLSHRVGHCAGTRAPRRGFRGSEAGRRRRERDAAGWCLCGKRLAEAEGT